MRVASITDLKIRKLKADPKKRLDLWDARIPGFGVRVAPSGTKTFIVMYRLHEKKRRVSIGRYPEMSLAEAKQVALNMRAQVASGKDPVAKPASHIDDFASVLNDFLKLHCERYNKPSTQRSTRRLLEKECLPHWGPRNIKEITRRDIITILDAMVARGSGGAANNAYAAISKFFNWCASRDLIDASPRIGVERPSKKNSRDRILLDKETSAVWTAASEVGFPFGNIIQLLMLTGQRRGEVATMERDHIDWETCMWHIPEELTKNSRPHAVPLSPLAISILEAVPVLHARFFFPARGSTTTCFSGFGRSKERLDKHLAIKPWRLHDLRRTAATGMAGLGIQPHIVERVLNHSTGQLGGVAGIYNRFQYIDEMRDALNKWAEHVISLQQNK